MAEKPAKQSKSDAFNKTSAEGAPSSPTFNRTELIAQVKGILAKNVTGNAYKIYGGEEELNPTANQKNLIKSIERSDIVFVDGPIGTGKTLWTTYVGLAGLASGKYKRIGISVPAVKADEDVGFLPGDLGEKMYPHLKPILDSIDDWIGKDLRMKLQDAGVIDIEAQAFMRGRTMKKTFLILDESQNASGKQLMTTLGRIGTGSTFVFMGDNNQNDRTKTTSAYVYMINRFAVPRYMNVDSVTQKSFVGHVVLDAVDVSRHPFLQMMVKSKDHLPLVMDESKLNHLGNGTIGANSNKKNGSNGHSHAQPQQKPS